MPHFSYRAKDATLQVVEGTIEAESEAAALNRLGSRGMFPMTLSELTSPTTASPASLLTHPARALSPRMLSYVTRQLADLLGGGLPLLNALMLLSQQTESRLLARIIESLAMAVRDGRSLSQALSDHPQIFPPLYISLVRAGEVSGSLEQALNRLADLGEHDADLRSRILSASVYPLFVLCIALAATIFLLTYVIPKLSLVFIESGHRLPLPTRILLSISRVVTEWWWALSCGILVLGFAIRQWQRSTQGRAMRDRVLLRLPGVGILVRKLEIVRLAHTLGILLSQGLPMLQALEVVAYNVSNTILRQAVMKMKDAVQEGSSLAAALKASGQVPVFVSNMVAVGEESGRVDTTLTKIASSYEREVDRTIRTLTSILEPLLLVAVGGVLMFIVLAMLLPVFQVELVLQ